MYEPPADENTDIDKVPISSLERWSAQWRTLYEQKQKLHDVSTEQVILGQLFTLVIALGAGLLLEQNKQTLLLISTTLVMYPALADMLSSNAAVLSASVHHDIDNIQGSKFWAVTVAISRTVLVSIAASALLGVFAGVIGVLFFDTAFLNTLFLAALSGSMAGVFGMPVMLAATFIVRKMQVNPDNVTAPLETAIFSSLTLAAVIIVARYLI